MLQLAKEQFFCRRTAGNRVSCGLKFCTMKYETSHKGKSKLSIISINGEFHVTIKNQFIAHVI